MDDFVSVMDKKCAVSPAQHFGHLAKKDPAAYVKAGQEMGLCLIGILKKVESAAIWHSFLVLDSQAKTVLKHLRCHFKSKITVPFQKMFTIVE